MSIIRDAYSGKTVLVTGHTGFKGSWLSAWLTQLGARVIGVSLDPPGSPSNYEVCNLASELEKDMRLDIRDKQGMAELIEQIKPDFVFHLAAETLVKPSYEDPLSTMETNAMGTANILWALYQTKHPCVAIMITSDKSYDNVEWVWGYRETDRLGGRDPYSASKGMAELAIRSFVSSYFEDEDCPVRVGVARAGNVIGGGDWAEFRIVPDCMQAWAQKQVVEVRSPAATRSWMHVLEPLSGYLQLGADLAKRRRWHGEAFNFGPAPGDNYTVSDLIDEMATHWQQVRWKDVSDQENNQHEAELLRLNSDKAEASIGWKPTMSFEETVRMTVQWYKHYYASTDAPMLEFTRKQIDNYTKMAAQKNRNWAKP